MWWMRRRLINTCSFSNVIFETCMNSSLSVSSSTTSSINDICIYIYFNFEYYLLIP
jgi:hypothetical protein